MTKDSVTSASIVASSSPATATARDFTLKPNFTKRAEGAAPVSSSGQDASARRNSPLWEAFQAKRSVSEARINELYAQIEAVKNGFSAETGVNLSEQARKKRTELIESVKKLRDEVKALDDQRRALFAQFNETLEALKRKNSEASAAKEKMPFKSVSEISTRIAQLEQTLESGRFTLSEERQMLGEVSKLRKLKKSLENLEGSSSNDVAGLRLRLDQNKMRQGEFEASINAKKDEIAAISAQIDELNGVQAADRARRADRQTELDRLWREIETEKKKVSDAGKEFAEKKNEARAAYLRGQARREELQRQAKLEEEIDVLERQLGRVTTESAIDRKWNECTNLINFFAPFLPSAATETAEAKSLGVDESKLRKPAGIDLAKVHVIRRKDDDEECYFKPAKQSSKKKTSSQSAPAADVQNDLSKLPFHILAALADMSLAIPKTADETVQLVETLQSRRKDLQSHRDASLAETQARQNDILAQIEQIRSRIASKDEQITPAMVKKMQQRAEEEGNNDEAIDTVEESVEANTDALIEAEADK
jgi:uncharacterized coiled-coil DUF342 family protein